MPEPVTASELLLQRIADDLSDVKRQLGSLSKPTAAKSSQGARHGGGSGPKTKKVDGR